MSTTEQTIYELLIRGNKEVADGYNSVSEALKKNGDALEDNKKKAGDAQQKLANFGGSISQVGGALGQLNPQLGQMTAALGGGIGQIQSLATQMGVLGIAVGGATLLISGLARDIAVLRAAEKEEADALDAQTAARSHQTQSIREEMDAIRQHAATTAEDAEIADRVRDHTATAAEVHAFYTLQIERQNAIVQANVAQQEHLRHALDEVSHSGVSMYDDINRLTQEIADNESATFRAANEIHVLEQRMQAAEGSARSLTQAMALLTEETEKQKRARQELADAQLADQTIAAQRAGSIRLAQQQRSRSGGGSARRLSFGDLGLAGDERGTHAGETTIDVSAENDRNAAKEEEAFQGRLRSQKAQRDAAAQAKKDEDERHKLAMQHIQEELAQWQGFGSAVGGVFDMIAAAQGKSAEAQKRASIITLIGQGTTEAIAGAIDLATAIGESASNPIVAATKFISSGMHIANSVRAFAEAGSGGGAGATAGGGGGGGGAPVRPTNQTQAQGGGGGQIVFNLNGPMVTAGSSVEGGRLFGNMLRAAIGARGSDRLGLPL